MAFVHALPDLFKVAGVDYEIMIVIAQRVEHITINLDSVVFFFFIFLFFLVLKESLLMLPLLSDRLLFDIKVLLSSCVVSAFLVFRVVPPSGPLSQLLLILKFRLFHLKEWLRSNWGLLGFVLSFT